MIPFSEKRKSIREYRDMMRFNNKTFSYFFVLFRTFFPRTCNEKILYRNIAGILQCYSNDEQNIFLLNNN